jgi:hypothetical protein
MLIESTHHTGHATVVSEAVANVMILFSGNIIRSGEIPAFIPADQAYYWSIPWQESERRALADLAAGRSRTFAHPADAVRYLLGSDGQ